MEVPLMAGVAQELLPYRVPFRVAVLKSRRRRRRLRTWGTRLAMVAVCVWVALVVVVGLGQ